MAADTDSRHELDMYDNPEPTIVLVTMLVNLFLIITGLCMRRCLKINFWLHMNAWAYSKCSSVGSL